jgi:hypothetical protein
MMIYPPYSCHPNTPSERREKKDRSKRIGEDEAISHRVWFPSDPAATKRQGEKRQTNLSQNAHPQTLDDHPAHGLLNGVLEMPLRVALPNVPGGELLGGHRRFFLDGGGVGGGEGEHVLWGSFEVEGRERQGGGWKVREEGWKDGEREEGVEKEGDKGMRGRWQVRRVEVEGEGRKVSSKGSREEEGKASWEKR